MKFLLILTLGVNWACLGDKSRSSRKSLERKDSEQQVFFEINSKVLKTAHLASVAEGNLQEFNYVSIQIQYEPIGELKKNIELKSNTVLADRGEAHITVLSPPEVAQLKTKLSSDQILEAISASTLQNEEFEVTCLGMGTLDQNRTYFVVVSSPGLFQRRQNIAVAFKAAGGATGSFDPMKFYPHITIGFVGRDLHLQDGVTKDKTSCAAELKLSAL